MSSREEELKKYLAKRERKKNREHIVERKEIRSVETEEAMDSQSFTTLFNLLDGKSRLVMRFAISIVIMIAAGVGLTYMGLEQPAVGIICIMILAFINLAGVAGIYSRLNQYQKFASGKLYPLTGWNNFISGRGKSFWSGSDYAHLRITFDQNQDVPDLERKALAAFIQTWINKWGHRYGAGQWTNGAPKEFNLVSTNRLEGHAHIGAGFLFVLDQLMDELPELLKLLTPQTLHVTISAAGPDLHTEIDDAEEREEERRSDQRHREMMAKDD